MLKRKRTDYGSIKQ